MAYRLININTAIMSIGAAVAGRCNIQYCGSTCREGGVFTTVSPLGRCSWFERSREREDGSRWGPDSNATFWLLIGQLRWRAGRNLRARKRLRLRSMVMLMRYAPDAEGYAEPDRTKDQATQRATANSGYVTMYLKDQTVIE